MSTLKTTNLQHASAASPAIVLDADSRATLNGLSYPTEGSLSGRNRLINADCRIDQRNAGASFTPVDNTYGLDRYKYSLSQASKLTAQQSSTAPTGFGFSYLHTVGAAANVTVGSGDIFAFSQPIEGFNTVDLAFGTASAVKITLSFWVRSSVTGTFSVAFLNGASDRSYVATYTISAANTWEQKTISITGDTSGTWVGATNGTGLRVYFDLGAGSTYTTSAGSWQAGAFTHATGSTNLVATNGATFYITGVQLELGSTATPFERRSYGQELALCQRYYQQFNSTGGQYDYFATGAFYSSTQGRFWKPLLTTMRASPTFSSTGTFYVDAVTYVSITSLTVTESEPESVRLNFTASSAGSNATGYGCFLASSTSSTEKMFFSAEL